MRIDKYLWCVRYFKTRNIATEACKKGHIKVNGEAAKPSREIYKNDQIVVRKNQINYQIEVLDIPESRVGANLRKTIIARKAKVALLKKIAVLLIIS